MSVVSQLYRLQLVDSERDEKRQRLAQIGESLGETQALVQAREAVTEIEGALPS